VQAVSVRHGTVDIVIEAPAGEGPAYAPVREAAEAAVLPLPGVTQARVVLTAERTPPGSTRPLPTEGAARRSARLSPELQAQGAPSPTRSAVLPDHVRRVIAVASGKGGVGKSTVAVNLALAFARRGLRAGLLDADVYGPSAPRMLGLTGRPEIDEQRRIVPLQAHGLKVMSVGFLLDAGAPLIWRGPMATSALTQMATGVAWGTETEPLDVLIVDLPPGTGDIQLTLIQKIALAGAVLVSTPQALALDDVRRGAAMFAKTGVPVLGVVENMAWFEDPTGARHAIFGEGGARRFAQEEELPFLAEVPLDPRLREAGDSGEPLASGPSAAVFDAMAAALA
jgi:ATP-binding protein involved in chromosome partitioning